MITTAIEIEGAHQYPLHTALLVYGASHEAFVMRHPVHIAEGSGAATLGAGRLMSPAFLRGLTRRLSQRNSQFEFLRSDVLVRQPGLTAWWTPPARRVLRHEDGRGSFSQINGFEVATPGMLWALTNQRTLAVCALADAERPSARTPIFVAPYWNTYDGGNVCLGTMAHPHDDSLETLDGWVDGFFGSAFTHPNANRGSLTTHSEGYFGLWTAARAVERFDAAWLVPAEQTVTQWLESL